MPTTLACDAIRLIAAYLCLPLASSTDSDLESVPCPTCSRRSAPKPAPENPLNTSDAWASLTRFSTPRMICSFIFRYATGTALFGCTCFIIWITVCTPWSFFWLSFTMQRFSAACSLAVVSFFFPSINRDSNFKFLICSWSL